MTKTVVIVCDGANINGGANRVAIETAIGLKKADWNVVLFAGSGPIERELINIGVKIICLDQIDILSDKCRTRAIIQGLWNYKAYISLYELLIGLRSDEVFVHIHTWCKVLSPSIFAAIRRYKRCKLFVTLHDYFIICPNGGLFNYRTSKQCGLFPMSCQCLTCNCDSRNYFHKIWRFTRSIIQKKIISGIEDIAFITISSYSNKLLNPYLKKRNFFLLKNPVNQLNNVIANISNNDYYIYIGRLDKDKGVELFCEAISLLGLKGIVIGDGSMMDELKEKFPLIKFTGWLVGKEKEEYILRAKCLIVTSLWHETFGLVVAEMKMYGIPSIVPIQHAASEQIANNKDGLVYESGNLNALKDTILLFESLDLNEIQKYILTHFDPMSYSLSLYCAKLIDIYMRL
ncbi:hypothetical protein HMPREF1074_03883 [Bacteroides xylanisolvens CL03T12C04]|jgi:glycosyltransferase involved in cell wall biosynthesis|uniref:Glycosyl transferase family 1 domain-containing protein n=1 Tax=Bacteroides xylanisolvens CL03T12C04 TaxID=997892 RepID=I9UQB3_9BACE|nr:glycosyltransferase family 4 protein [Bacteroides xylanisolvens]EIY84713.1 hypothetical protein HMPREF1074_03883 [Bacteroides xylanisolvens CL03T12C04]MBT0703333.1 Glycosyl transferases group 1 [Bacteroides xylanisolvens CL03T12C04]RGI95810.1 glycosyltransferase [Bacteroides xylanisolvens]